MDPAVREQIQATVSSNNVVLFMKGTPQSPQCGFSATVAGILDSLLPSYASVNVLADPKIREGIKEFSEWPTIPQLYVKGEFIGGCDIVKEMHESGQLEEVLGLPAQEIPAPQITITAAAAQALKSALGRADEVVRLEINARFEHGLSVGNKQDKDVVVKDAPIPLVMDRGSAKRANGLTVDFVDSPNGQAFKIDNPNEPPRVKQISVKDLKSKIDAGAIQLFDVRSTKEREIAHLPASRLLDRAAQDHIMQLPKDTPLHFICHTGNRSDQAGQFFIAQGFKHVFNVVGGIDAWSRDIDPDVPRY
jgi:monothiol glutaredoxin